MTQEIAQPARKKTPQTRAQDISQQKHNYEAQKKHRGFLKNTI
jgi:hypothetical protein